MPELIDEIIDWQGIQMATKSLAEQIHEDRTFYFLYGLLDGIQLFASESRSVREQLPLISSIELSDDWEYSPEGYAITIAGALIYGAYSAYGCYFKDDSKVFHEAQIAYTMPFVRNGVKSFKWSWRGWRNVENIAILLNASKTICMLILFPVAIALGVASLLNRTWIRWMQIERKAMVKSNAELCEEVLTKGCLFHTEPNFLQIKDYSRFAASFVFVEDPKNLNEHVLYYVDKTGKITTPIPVDNRVLFEKRMQTMLLANLREQMKRTLRKSDGLLTDRLSFMPSWPLDNKQNRSPADFEHALRQHDNSYVFLTDTKAGATPQLIYIDKKGNRCSVPYALQAKFKQNLMETIKDKNLVGLTSDQVRELIPEATDYQIGLTYDDWSLYRESIIGNKELSYFGGDLSTSRLKRQSDFLRLRCYLSVLYAGFIDSLYFYFGAILLAYMIPPLFIGMVVASVSFAVIYIITRFYEEADFQLKPELSITKIKFALCEKALDKLVSELNDITFQIASCLDEQRKDQLVAKQKALTDCLNIEVNVYYIPLRQLLYNQTVPYDDTVIVDGLRNGLAIQGVMASTLFVVVAVMSLMSMPCPPLLIIGFTLAGFAVLYLSVTSSLRRHQAYLDTLKDIETINPIKQLDAFLSSIKMVKNEVRDEAKRVSWGEKIEPPVPYLALEICEDLRYTLSGGLKAGKMATEFAHLDLEHTNLEEPGGMATFAVAGALGLAGASIFGIRQYAKGRTTAQPDALPRKPAVNHESATVIEPLKSSKQSKPPSDDPPSQGFLGEYSVSNSPSLFNTRLSPTTVPGPVKPTDNTPAPSKFFTYFKEASQKITRFSSAGNLNGNDIGQYDLLLTDVFTSN